MGQLHKYCVVQVFGTDLDHEAVATARTGVYADTLVAAVAETRLRRHFSRADGQFQITRELRDKLVFAVQDVISDPPFTRMDLISARDLLIYFDADLQKRLIPLFHHARNPDDQLLLGTAVTVGEFGEHFTVTDPKWKAAGVKRLTRRWLSRWIVAIGGLFSRFFISSLAVDSIQSKEGRWYSMRILPRATKRDCSAGSRQWAAACAELAGCSSRAAGVRAKLQAARDVEASMNHGVPRASGVL